MSSCNGKTKKPSVAALILARGGSKSVPGKNIFKIGGKPLIVRALEKILEFGKFDSVWVSTDDKKIEEVARSVDDRVQIFHRSDKNAADTASSLSAIQEFLDVRKEIDIVGNIQCTSPFIKAEFLEKGYNLIINEDYDSVFSVTRDKKFRWNEDKHYIFPLNFQLNNRLRRQDMTGELIENGMFYFSKRELIERGYLQGGRMFFVEIPFENSLDIDSRFDIFLMEQILYVKKLEKEKSLENKEESPEEK